MGREKSVQWHENSGQWPVASEIEEAETIVIEKRQNEANLFVVLIIDILRLRTNQGEIELENEANLRSQLAHGGGCSRAELRRFEQLGDQHPGNPGVRLFRRVAEVQKLERVGLRKDPAQVEESRVGDKRVGVLELPVDFREQGAGPSKFRLLLLFERNEPRL